MTLRQFLDASYTLLVEDAVRLGADLSELMDNLSRWVWKPSLREYEVTPTEEVVSSANDESLAALEKMMLGVSV